MFSILFFLFVYAMIFIFLKTSGVVKWSWWWLPSTIVISILFVIFITLLITISIGLIFR